MNFIQKIPKFISDFYSIFNKNHAFRKEEAQLRERYTATEKKCEHSPFTVIVCVDGGYQQGGLSDRLRGVGTIYTYCKQHGYNFKVHFTQPFLLQDYLSPNQVDWPICKEEISYNKEEAEPILLFCHLLNHKFHKFYLNRRIKELQKTKKQVHIYTNTYFYDDQFSQSFSELYKIAPPLQALLDSATQEVGENYISMAFRFQQLLGDFRDDGYDILDKPAQEAIIEKCCLKLKQIRDEFHPNKNVLVTSDSETFVRIAKERFPDFVRTISGNIVHIDYTDNAAYADYAKTFVDMLTIGKSETIYQMRTGKMYRSGFGKRAARIFNTPFKEIAF